MGLRQLARLVERARLATLSGEPNRLSRANAAFHHHVIELAGNRLLAALLEPLEGRLRWVFQQIDDPVFVWEEHRELCEAIASGDVETAGACSLRHVQRNRATALRVLYGED